MRTNRLKIFAIYFLVLVGVFGLIKFGSIPANASTTVDLGLSQNIGDTLGLATTDIRVTIAKIIRVALGFVGVVVLGLMLYGGFLYMTAAGSDEQISKAKKIMINGAVGLAIVLSSFGITSFVISQLVGATTGSGTTTGGGGGGGGGGGFSVNQFGIRSLPPSMTYCVRNVNLAVVFNQEVDLTSVQGNIIVRDVAANTTVAGSWVYGTTQNTIIFNPSGSCAPSVGNDCLAANTQYSLVIANASQVRSLNNNLTLNCTLISGGFVGCGPVSFTSGSAVDRTPPVITITSPATTSPQQLGSTINYTINYTDDNGIQNTSLYVNNPATGQPYLIGSVPSTQCRQSGSVTIPWNTIGYAAGNYTVSAVGIDFAGQSDSDSGVYSLRSEHCFNGVLESSLGELQAGPPDCGGECGACAGGSCSVGTDCSSGVCSNGRCINAMSITGFSPTSGAPGTFVSIFGNYFGTSTGQVYFSTVVNPNPNVAGNWVVAQPPASCGSGFSYWGNNQIIVASPVGASPSATIKVVTTPRDNGSGTVAAETDLTSNHGLPLFQTNNIVRPGLCSLTPNIGTSGDSVSLTGVSFGPTINATTDNVSFGTSKAQVLVGSNNNPSWSDTFITAAVPGIDTGNVGVKVANNGVDSNSIKYSLVPGVNITTPIIESISTSTGARGEYLTIVGRNFGKILGTVTFKTAANGSAILGDTNFPTECKSSIWTDTKIIIKAPSTLALGSTYFVQVITGDSVAKESPFDSRVTFVAQAGTPSPGICLITPSGGTIPLAASTTIDIFGEYFTVGASRVYFWGPNATNQNLITNRPQAVFVSTQTATHLVVSPISGTITGPVSVYRTTDSKVGNPGYFSVSDCTDQGVTCDAVSHCCAEGPQIGMCISNNLVCGGSTRSTGYLWRFSTNDIPDQPHVYEKCDIVTEAGQALPTPSPSVQWDQGGLSDSHNVCKTSLVTVEFTSTLNPTSVSQSSNNVRVYKCASFTNNVCNGPSLVTLDPSSYILNSASNTNGEHEYLSIKPSAVWAAGSWYQVVLMEGIRGNDPTINLPLASDKPCIPGSAYCFAFQASGQDCTLRQVVVTPYSYTASKLQNPLTNPKDNKALIYQALGLSSQRCIMLDTSNITWGWTSENTAYADIFGSRTNNNASISTLANTVGINLPNDSVNIRATAVISGAGAGNKVGVSPLKIDLTNPTVIDWWPKCQTACLNSNIGIKFNVALSSKNLSQPQTVRLLKCSDENCNTTTRVGGIGNYTLQNDQIVFTIGNLYDPARGVNLMNNGYADSGDNTNFSQFTFSPETHAGAGSFAVQGYRNTVTDSPIPINHDHSYLVDFWAKAGNADGTNYDPANFLYVGVYPIDADGYTMYPWMWTGMPGSETTLAQPVKKGDTTIVLSSNGNNWYKGNAAYLRHITWYPYTNKKGYTYPVYTYSRNSVRFTPASNYTLGTWPENGIVGNTITLSNPWPGPDLAAGTAVRNESGGYSYMYFVYRTIPRTWTRYTTYLRGNNVPTSTGIKLPVGVENIKFLFLNNYGNPSSTNILRYSDFWFSDLSTTSTPVALLEPNTIYKVSVSASSSNPLTALNNVWSRAVSSDPASYSKPYNKEFSWKFRTKDSSCVADRIEINPVQYNAKSITEKAIFTSQAFSSPDSCSSAGQALDPWASNWTWTSSDSQVAKVTTFATKGDNLYCNSSCTLRGSTEPFSGGTVAFGICGNGRVEAGEDCDYPNLTGGCGLNCLFLGTSTRCGNGVVDAGEACDPANAATSAGCDAKRCVRLGSSQNIDSTLASASLCGNGLVGSGEDCDIGLNASATNTKSRIDCSGSCLHAGTKLSSRFCYYNQGTRAGFDKAAYDLACADAISICGDGVIGPDEDASCETGLGTKASWCNDSCKIIDKSRPNIRCAVSSTSPTGFSEGCGSNGQLLGSSLTYTQPSSCGDGVVGLGEESFCETSLVTTTHNGIDPWALVSGVGKGVASGDPAAQRAQISASTKDAFGKTIFGSGEYAIVCGYHTDLECAAINPNFGVGSDSCCYARPVISNYIPANNSAHVCLNTALELDFDGIVDGTSLNGTSSPNIVVARGEAAAACPAGEIDVTSIAFNNVNNASLKWYEKLFKYVERLFSKVFGLFDVVAAPTYTTRVWCVGRDSVSLNVSETSSTTSKVSIGLSKPLAANSHYTVIIKDAIKNNYGVSVGKTSGGNYLSYTFDTDNTICQIDSVVVSPAAWNFSNAGSTTTLRASVLSEKGAIQPIANVYAWNYSWEPLVNQFVTIQNTGNASTTLITSLNRNGEIDVRALANLTVNSISSATGTVASGSSHITVFLCENPWPPKSVLRGTGYVSAFPYRDSAGNNSGFNNVFDGSAILPSDSGVGDGYFNFSTYYCADNGSTGTFDDFPYLKPAVQNTAANLKVNVGTCEFSGDVCSPSNDQFSGSTWLNNRDCGYQYNGEAGFVAPVNVTSVCGAVVGGLNNYFINSNGDPLGCTAVANCSVDTNYNSWLQSKGGSASCIQINNLPQKKALTCYAYSPLKRFIFTNEKNTDGIGVQIFPNPKHLAPLEWYQLGKASGGLGFTGSVQSTKLDGYDAVSDGNNIYSSALNYSTGNSSLYDVVYLFSISSDAKPETRHVFEEMVKNFKFNTNLLNNDGYCGPTVSTPSYKVKCDSDQDCPVGEVCSNQKEKLSRNYKRLQDLKLFDDALSSYSLAHSGSYPSLNSGSYLAGQSISTWPSWTIAGTDLGISVPTDPINKMATGGTCKKSPSRFCTTDSDCPNDTCVIHDKTTAWSTEDRRFSLACNSNSYAYRYIFNPATGYTIKTRFEDPGVGNIANLTNFISGYGFSNQASRYPSLGNWSNLFNTGICDNITEISSSNKGECGDGTINRLDGENCDPPGAKEFQNISQCTNNIATTQMTVVTCQNNCQLSAPVKATCNNVTTCGNGVIEPGENCDDGRALNGKYNHCNATCSGPNPAYTVGGTSPGFCGDGAVNSVYEVCDPSGVGIALYGSNKESSCSADCQSFGPYCGDGLTNSGFDSSNVLQTENCDAAGDNGQICIPEYGKTCSYCDSTCHTVTRNPLSTCGDGVVNPGYELCDRGSSNANSCTPAYSSSCTYCSTNCQVEQTILSDRYCGNSTRDNPPEACDDGMVNNGLKCTPSYNNSCTYCNATCSFITSVPRQEFCGDGVVQSTYEACDGNVTCTGANGLTGVRPCGTTCQFKHQASEIVAPDAWWPLGQIGPNFTEKIHNFPSSCAGTCPAVVTNGGVDGLNSSRFTYKAVAPYDGVTSTIDNTLFSNVNGFSYELWVKPEVGSAGVQYILTRYFGAANRAAFVELAPYGTSQYYYLFYIRNAAYIIGTSASLRSYGAGYDHLAFTYAFSGSTSTINFYINGARANTIPLEVNTGSSLLANPTSNLVSIGTISGSSVPFSGQIQNIKFYNRTLSAIEVFNLYDTKGDVCDTGLPACTSYTYSAWGTCQPSGTQTRNVVSTIPAVCKDGAAPVLTQSCTYTAPICTSFTYNAGPCQIGNTQTLTVATSLPAGCVGGTPLTSRSCVYQGTAGQTCTINGECISGLYCINSVCSVPPACTSWTYNGIWGPCQADDYKYQTLVSKSPAYCVGVDPSPPRLYCGSTGGGGGGGGSCFVAGTKVMTPSGSINIEDLHEGAEVLSFDTSTNKTVTAYITKYREYLENHYYLINGEIKVTSEHPLAVVKGDGIEFTMVKDLKIGDKIKSIEGPDYIIKTMKYIPVPEGIMVYNPAVSGNHNYFIEIGEKGVLVHNLLLTLQKQ